MYIEMCNPEAYTFIEKLDIGYKIFYANGMNRLFKVNTVVEELQELLKTQKWYIGYNYVPRVMTL